MLWATAGCGGTYRRCVQERLEWPAQLVLHWGPMQAWAVREAALEPLHTSLHVVVVVVHLHECCIA